MYIPTVYTVKSKIVDFLNADNYCQGLIKLEYGKKGNDVKDLLSHLEAYASSDFYPMHMPGHKRTHNWRMPNPYRIDITEIENFDNLHHAEGILKQGMERTAKLFGSKRSFHLVNGSTVGILAGILSLTRKGDTVLMARNCHKAVYHALILNELNPLYLTPPYEEGFSLNGSISPESVKSQLQNNPQVKLVVITSPSYEGVVSDIWEIADICHEKNVPLFVDEAHGAHLGFSEKFPPSALSQGADLVVQSFHKTLPSLTQTAVLHIGTERVSGEKVERKLAILETSSPSYVLMGSIERCISILAAQKEELFQAWFQKLEGFHEQTKILEKFRVLGYGKERKHLPSSIHAFDPSKLVISTKGTNFTGGKLADFLRKNMRIEPEMISADYIVAMTSLCDTHEGMDRLAKGILAADKRAGQGDSEKHTIKKIPTLKIQMTPAQAEEAESQIIPWKESKGEISKDFVFAYPPGIPIVAPGEELSTEIIGIVESLKESGVKVEVSGKENNNIAVIKR